jgi:hypothetical protein
MSHWILINNILKSLEKLMKDYDIALANVDGKLLAELALDRKMPSVEDLVECIVNKDEILKIIKLPKLMYKGEKGKLFAVIKI